MLIVRQGQDEKEASLRRYFFRAQRGSPVGAIVLCGFGGFIAFCSFISMLPDNSGQPDNSIFVKILFLLAGVALCVFGILEFQKIEPRYRAQLAAAEPKPPDGQVKSWLDEGFKKTIEHSQFMLSLGEAEISFRDPLVIITPLLQAGMDDWSLWKQGEDRVLRFGYYRLIVIRLTDRHLGAYTCDYNFVRNVVLNERTTEYHYQDVVSVATQEDSAPYNLPTGQKLTTKQEFSLSVASGESIRVGVEAALIRQITGAEGIPDSGAERAVATIRAMLRDKKGASHSLAAA
jgi:hypothetical protein